jgi:hypothetical protein
MAYTVQSAFNQFYDAINLPGDHRDTANIRKKHLIELLGGKFEIVDSFGMGSIPKFTALKGHADLDIFLVLHYTKHCMNKSPSEVLKSIREVLAYKTTVRRNGQAVTLSYTTWPSVDIVPVYFTHKNGVITHYNVPDMNTETWIQSRPKEHADAIASASSNYGENFRKIIKMVKSWNLSHSNYLQSYHIEVLALRTINLETSDLSWSLLSFFKEARDLLIGPLWHDLGFVDNYLGIEDRYEIVKRFDTAIDLARTAWFCTHFPNKDHEAAIKCWKNLFGDKFPSYG